MGTPLAQACHRFPGRSSSPRPRGVSACSSMYSSCWVTLLRSRSATSRSRSRNSWADVLDGQRRQLTTPSTWMPPDTDGEPRYNRRTPGVNALGAVPGHPTPGSTPVGQAPVTGSVARVPTCAPRTPPADRPMRPVMHRSGGAIQPRTASDGAPRRGRARPRAARTDPPAAPSTRPARADPPRPTPQAARAWPARDRLRVQAGTSSPVMSKYSIEVASLVTAVRGTSS